MPHSTLLILLFVLLYTVLHSLLAARRVKAWGRARLPGFDRWYRLFYNTAAILTLLPLFWLLQLPDRTLYTVPAPWAWLLWAGQGLSGLGMLIAVLQANPSYFVGLAQLGGDPEETGDRLVINGLYRYVRHPLYLFSLLFLWLSPVMTLNRFVLFGLATLYLYIGSLHEESRLECTFGQAYRDYQQAVPRFIPALRRFAR